MILNIVLATVPALIVFLATVIINRSTMNTIKQFLDREGDAVKGLLLREAEDRAHQKQMKSKELTLPLRLQAYERMTLFCSRIDIVQIALRMNRGSNQNAKATQLHIIATIEEEFKHNVTQQMYMSEELWKIMLLAKTEAISIARKTLVVVDENSGSESFVTALFQSLKENPQVGHLQAQIAIKKEVALLF